MLNLAAYKTQLGEMYSGDAKLLIESALMPKYKGQIQLIFTSPPFPLNRRKKLETPTPLPPGNGPYPPKYTSY